MEDVHEFIQMTDEAMMCPDRYAHESAAEFADRAWKRLQQYKCTRWTKEEVLALVMAWDNRPTPEGTISFSIRLGSAAEELADFVQSEEGTCAAS